MAGGDQLWMRCSCKGCYNALRCELEIWKPYMMQFHMGVSLFAPFSEKAGVNWQHNVGTIVWTHNLSEFEDKDGWFWDLSGCGYYSRGDQMRICGMGWSFLSEWEHNVQKWTWLLNPSWRVYHWFKVDVIIGSKFEWCCFMAQSSSIQWLLDGQCQTS